MVDPTTRDTPGEWKRVLWLDQRIREGRFPSVADLAEEFECSSRTAFNTVAFLRDSLAAPLVYRRAKGGYAYRDRTYALPSVFLAEGELLALVLAEQVARHYLGTAVEAPLAAAIAKLRRSLPETVTVQLGELADGFRIAGGATVDVPLELLADVQRAIRERLLLRLTYYTASRNETSEREIEPHFLANVSGDWMLVAWDRLRGADRTFMLSRIQEHAVLETRFARRPELESDRYSASRFATEYGLEPYSVALRFDAEKARWIRERTWHPSQSLEEQEDGRVILKMTVAGHGDLFRWILSHGAHVEILAPDWLRERVVEEWRRAVDTYLQPDSRRGLSASREGSNDARLR